MGGPANLCIAVMARQVQDFGVAKAETSDLELVQLRLVHAMAACGM